MLLFFYNAAVDRMGIRVSTALLCLWCMVVLYALCAGAQQGTLKIIDMYYDPTLGSENTWNAFRSGINASLWSRNYTVAGGLKIEFIPITPEWTVSAVTNAIDDVVTKHPDVLAVFGPVGVRALLCTLPALKKHGMVALAPLVGSSKVRQWNPHYYFLTTDTMTAVYGLVRYAVTLLRVRRLGFMYLTDVHYGDEEYDVADSLMKGMGYAFCGVFALTGTKDWQATDAEFQKEFDQFAATNPQAVLMYGKQSMSTAVFITQLLRDARTSKVYILGDFYSQSIILETWAMTVAQGVPFNSGQVILTGENPLPTDTRYGAMVRFYKDMEIYLRSEGQKSYENPQIVLDDSNIGEFMVNGWFLAEVLSQLFASTESVRDRAAFAESIFSQRRYRVDDILVGTFGGACSGQALAQGAVCNCNQGARTVYFKKFVGGFRSLVDEEGEFSYPLDVCYTQQVRLYSPINVVSVLLQDYPFLLPFLAHVYTGLSAALPLLKFQRHPTTFKVIVSTDLEARHALEVEKDDFITHLVTGFITDDMLKVDNITFIDPMFVEPHVSSVLENVIYFLPTIEQEMFVLSEWLSKGGKRGANVHVVVRGRHGEKVATLIKRTLMTFGLNLHSQLLISWDSPFAGLPTDGDVFLIGLRPSDTTDVCEYLLDNPDVRLFMRFHDFTKQYSSIDLSTFTKPLMDRVIFVTSFPHWGDPTSSSSTVQAFQAAVKDRKKWIPSVFQTFAVARALYSTYADLEGINSQSVAHALYSRMMLSLDDMVYGPFNDGKDASCPGGVDGNGRPCLKNYGATSLSVWSMTCVTDPTEPVLYGPVTPSMIYFEPSTGLSRGAFLGLIIGSVMGLVLLIVLAVLLVYCCRDARNNRNAPRKREDPVTLVFTDIQSSTALWAACPDSMADAVDTHHRLIRRLIAKHRCYEVKTVGDSFMIACKNPHAAVQLVGDLQRTFLEHDWGTSAIDEAYREFEEQWAKEDADYEPPTARLDAAVYRAHWRGLRVRAGVHTGLSDIRHDAVTKRYDYYGSASNTAARTESIAHGGQVLLTRAAFMALSTAERAELDVTALGAVELRGVPEPVEMLQLNTVPGRAFEKLRSGGGEKEREKSALCDPLFTVLSALFECMRRCLMSLLS